MWTPKYIFPEDSVALTDNGLSSLKYLRFVGINFSSKLITSGLGVDILWLVKSTSPPVVNAESIRKLSKDFFCPFKCVSYLFEKSPTPTKAAQMAG